MIVYIYTFPNGKKYVGQTIQTLAQRAHRGEAYRECPLVYNAIQKYGWDNIKKEIVVECDTQEELNRQERFFIAFYKTTDINFGYNLQSGGNNGTMSDETKKKISEANKGRIFSEKHRQKLRESHIGKKLSEETKEKMCFTRGEEVICLETKKIYGSVGIATKAVGLKDRSSIGKVCAGKRKTAAGYHWMYLSDYEKLKDKEENQT